MNTSSFKRLAVMAIALLVGTAAVAQTTSKQINNIKRSPLYLYAEATMESAEDASSLAYELLLQQVKEYIASKKRLAKADNVLIKDVRSQGQELSMMRGTMYRVFVYVKKTDIEGVSNTTAINSTTGSTVTIAEEVPVEEVAVDYQEEVAEEVAETVASPLNSWQQQAVNSLLECADLAQVRAKLNRMKQEYKVKRYGTADKCPSASEAFWIIFDASGKLVTVLGTGDPQRIDYRTMRLSSLDAHKGMNALWFNFAK